jgi:hypothetical protein
MPAQNAPISSGISMLSSATQFVRHDINNRHENDLANISPGFDEK